jgi:hypothetical protein
MNPLSTQQPRAVTQQVVTFIPRDIQQQILRAVATTRCGDVRVVIQDGEIVQIMSSSSMAA